MTLPGIAGGPLVGPDQAGVGREACSTSHRADSSADCPAAAIGASMAAASAQAERPHRFLWLAPGSCVTGISSDNCRARIAAAAQTRRAKPELTLSTCGPPSTSHRHSCHDPAQGGRHP